MFVIIFEILMQRYSSSILGIAMIVCRNPATGKYLCVQQKNQKWWIPGGKIEAPQSFFDGARRECLEQAGINLDLKGVLRIQQSLGGFRFNRLRIIFYGQPLDPYQTPKKNADKHSLKAAYLTIDEIFALKHKWRTSEIATWPSYLQQGGKIYPLSIIKQTSQ